MKWNIKRILTDLDDQPFNQYWDESTEEFRPQPQIATQRELEKITDLIKSSDPERHMVSEPPHLKNIQWIDERGPDKVFPKWFHNGYFYGSTSDERIFKSEDGINWGDTPVATVPMDYPNNIEILMITDTGRFIVGYKLGEVFISNENGEFESDEPAFTTGNMGLWRGHFKYRNIIGINSYETPGMENQHEAWLSVDNGETFKKVFEPADMGEMPEPDRMHFHDMEYDPYSNRLFIWNGDFGNNNLWYSDDFGESWKAVWDKNESINNCTQVLATKDGIVLGNDTRPGGVAFVPVDRRRRSDPEIDGSLYDPSFWQFSSGRYIAGRRWVDREKGIYLMPYYSENEKGMGHIAFSRDGYFWHEIYRATDIGFDFGFRAVTYGNGKLVGIYNDESDYTKIFVADLEI